MLDNRRPVLLRKTLALGLVGARGLALHLLRNYYGESDRRREKAYAAAHKPTWLMTTINCQEAVNLVTQNDFDLILNARTRYIYKPDILRAPRLGCINVHHGLLPDQRGTMCDLWALHERQTAGFSIHEMIEEVDAGRILLRVPVSTPGERDYISYLRRSCGRELEETVRLLQRISEAGRLEGWENKRPQELKVRKNPTFRQIREMLRGGLRL